MKHKLNSKPQLPRASKAINSKAKGINITPADNTLLPLLIKMPVPKPKTRK